MVLTPEYRKHIDTTQPFFKNCVSRLHFNFLFR